MTTPSPDHKALAKAALDALGGRPSLSRHWDDRHKTSVVVLACADSPHEGVTSYVTIGVSDVPLIADGKELDTRAELVGVCDSRNTEFASYLSTAAFWILNSGYLAAPGVVFPDVLAMYAASPTMKHLLFMPPALWEDRLQTVELGDKRVSWLLAVPISEQELRFAQRKGPLALEELFESHKIDVFDLERASVVAPEPV